MTASFAPEHAFDSSVGHHLELTPLDTVTTARCIHSEISKKALTVSPRNKIRASEFFVERQVIGLTDGNDTS